MMNFDSQKMKNRSTAGKGIISAELYQGLDFRALIGNSKEAPMSIQEQIELGVQDEKKKIKEQAESLQKTRALLNEMIESIQQERRAWFEAMQEELVTVVAEVVKNLVEVELVQNKEVIKGCFNKVFKLIEEEDIQKILMNEADLNIIKEECTAEYEKLVAGNRVEFDARPDVPRGTIQAQSKLLKIDASVLERLRRFIADTLGGGS